MMNVVFIVLTLLYFFSGIHQKVLNHFGLSQRDNRFIFIGFFLPSFISGIIELIAAIIAGTSVVSALLLILIASTFIYLNYRSL